ncbi:hypothetical protein TRFO_05957 [Tritrichomonas foetus]|uniref:Protein kinase domain-containing protein n=1 Tax=Tritrichomonas foetus TaxID=1144522 RepID=A0A1J4K7I2_9EUKA|nr:hypothetical protein TRFO_05957 [Tritrichomonas foetus]|eukprot:OHT05373.1 hypothetical protein TRFO_05957 [Tritrichomonas foetus]
MSFLKGIFIDLNRFGEPGNEIGRGKFGTCYKVIDQETGKEYAAKVTNNALVSRGDQQEKLLREVVILKTIVHKAVLQFVGFNLYDFENKPQPVIITEFMSNGALDEMINREIKHTAPKEWNSTKKQICIIGVALAMRHLHRNNIVHRDLKPANILLDENLYPRVADFGLSRALDDQNCSLTLKVGSPIFMAPEMLIGDAQYDLSIDVYSFGILLYQLVTGKIPFYDFFARNRGASIFQLTKWVTTGNRPSFKDVNINKDFQELMESCWAETPNDRPTFDDVCDILLNHRDFCVDDNVDMDEVEVYVDSVLEGESSTGKAIISISAESDTFEEFEPVKKSFKPVVKSTVGLPESDSDKKKLYSEIMRLGFSSYDQNLEMDLFSKLCTYIQDREEEMVKITKFANQLAAEGNKKAENFLSIAFGSPFQTTTIQDNAFSRQPYVKINLSPETTRIGQSAFSENKKLVNVNIPPKVSYLGKAAFLNCVCLKWINLTCPINEISESTFQGCKKLALVQLPDELKVIKKKAFSGCASLQEINIPASVTQIEDYAFESCANLKKVILNGKTKYTKRSFPWRVKVIELNH